MKAPKLVGALTLAVTAALTLGACGSSSTSSTKPPVGATGGGATSASGATSGSGGGAGSPSCGSGTLNLAGSTAQGPAISAFKKKYQTACSGSSINDAAGGSGAGYTAFTGGTVDFAGSDYPLSDAQQPDANKRCGGTAIDIPLVPGGVAVIYNLSGVSDLKLTAQDLAMIFAGKITKWDDPAIKKDNPSAPSTAIQTFHRSDGSGTSFNFSNYLSNVAKADWTYGANKVFPAPASVGQGAMGSAGVAQGVKSTDGAIGYVDYSYAKPNSISFAQVGRVDGSFAALTSDAVSSFIAPAMVAGGSANDLKLTFDYTQTTGYPIPLVTYEFVCQTGNKNASLLKGFLSYGAGSGQDLLPDLGYVKLPASLQSKVTASISSLT